MCYVDIYGPQMRVDGVAEMIYVKMLLLQIEQYCNFNISN